MGYKTNCLIIASMLILFSVPAFAQSTMTGIENVTFSTSYVQIPQGGGANVTYNLTVVEGSSEFATKMYISNNVMLGNKDIVVLLHPSYLNAPAHGTMSIFPSADTPTGSYYIDVTGSNPNVTVNEAQFLVMVTPPIPPTTSINYTTVTSSVNTTSFITTTFSVPTTSSIAPTTIVTTAIQSGVVSTIYNLSIVYKILIFLVAVAIVAGIIALRSRTPKKPAPMVMPKFPEESQERPPPPP